jgi:hypothetical protein
VKTADEILDSMRRFGLHLYARVLAAVRLT